jgi:hypothetical protein
MKTFTQYLYHTQKVYEFRIKLAEVELDDNNLARIKSALDAYGVENISKPKRLPIQNHRDFPKLGPCECHTVDISLKYPTTTEQLQHIVAERAMLDKGKVLVYNKDQYDQMVAAEEPGKPGSILIDPKLVDTPNSQELVGQTRVGSLIKELMKEKTDKFEIAGKDKTNLVTTDSLPQGVKSPVGSNQNKIPSTVKGK